MKLTEFYGKDEQEELLAQLGASFEENRELVKTDCKIKIGNPVVIADATLARLYESILLYSIHLYPGKKVASTLTIGNFISAEGQNFITHDVNVGFVDFAYLHLARSIEEDLLKWEKVYGEAVRLSKKIILHFQRNKLEGKLPDFWDYSGHAFANTPSKEFVERMKALLKDSSKIKDIAEDIQKVIELCEPFTELATVMMDMRKKLGIKGVVHMKNGHMSKISPAASGNAGWVTTGMTNDLMRAVPSANTLFMLLSACGISSVKHFGSSTRVEQGKFTTFLLPEDLVQSIDMALSSKLPDPKDYCVSVEDDKSVISEKASLWFNIQKEILKDYLQENLMTFVSRQVLGTMVFADKETSIIELRPVISQTLWEDEGNGEMHTEHYDAFMMDVGNGYALPVDSIYGQEISREEIIAEKF